jgi:hypothetical protein
MASFTSRPLYTWGIRTRNPLDREAWRSQGSVWTLFADHVFIHPGAKKLWSEPLVLPTVGVFLLDTRRESSAEEVALLLGPVKTEAVVSLAYVPEIHEFSRLNCIELSMRN